MGHFFIGKTDWDPVFPLSVTLKDFRADVGGEKAMQTLLRRTGDCASCHRGAEGAPNVMPAVYLREKAL